MATQQDARRRRSDLVLARQRWGRGEDAAPAHAAARTPAQRDRSAGGVRDVIRASWDRSGRSVHDDLASAPLADVDATASAWRASPLQRAVATLEEELRRVADDGDLVVAVTDPRARILWTCGGRVMRRRAERVNFVPGGRWDEASVGTNALDLALRTQAPATVWSAEHFAPVVHGWVCWAAPVLGPSGAPLGVLDLSTTWERSHPLGLTTARTMAALLGHEVAAMSPGPASRPASASRSAPLRLRLLGSCGAELDGVPLALTRRQLEVLALLALHPRGLSADDLHDALYGDAPVSRSTLKAEVSRLRSTLGGRIGSRPYRLELACTSDVDDVRRALATGDAARAVGAWGGDVLAGAGGTDSPVLRRVDDELAVGVREAVLRADDPVLLARYRDVEDADPFVVPGAVGGR